MCGACSRRSFVLGGLALGGLAALVVDPAIAASAEDRTIACGFSNEAFDKYLASTSSMPKGDASFHKALIGELKSILQVIPVDPGFRYVEARNAFASRRSVVEGTKGTVFIGVSLVRELLEPQDGGISVAGVLAHECAHIFQFYSSYYQTLLAASKTSRLLELHADLLAGYYVAKKTGAQPNRISVFSRTLIQFGTYGVGSQDDHGTPGQRNAAMDKGIMLALAGKSFDQTASEGADYVAKL